MEPLGSAGRPIRNLPRSRIVLPDWRASHGWIGLFSVAPMTSVWVWIDGIVFSIVFGWVTGVVFGLVYNRLIRR
jgi:hypothetical protein